MSRFADLVIKRDRSKEEDQELHVLAQQLDYVAADLGTVIGPSGVIARLRAGSVVLDNAGMHVFYGGSETIRMETDGDFFLGTDISAAATTSFAFFSNAQTYNSESIGSGDLLIGDNTASKANLLWDKSTGQLLFRGGTTTQGYIDTDGSATFAAGDVQLNALGIVLSTGTATTKQIRWIDTTLTAGTIYGFYTGTSPNRAGRLLLSASSDAAGGSPYIQLKLNDPGGTLTTSMTISDPTDVSLAMSSEHNTSNTIVQMADWAATYDGATGDGFGQQHDFILRDTGESTLSAARMEVYWSDAAAVSRDAIIKWSVIAGGDSAPTERLSVGADAIILNEASDDVDFRIESNNFSHAFMVDAGTDSILLAQDVRAVSGTAYPAVGINTPLPQQLFEVHKTTWDQVFDEGIGDFDAVSPAWDKEVFIVANFDAEVDADGDLNDSGDAAHDGANGLEITFDDTNAAYGVMNLDAVNQTTGVVSFWFNANDVTLATSENIIFAACHDGGGTTHWYLRLIKTATGYRIDPTYRADDNSNIVVGSGHAISGATWYHLLLTFSVSTGVGNDDGVIHFYVDGVLIDSVTDADNDTRDWDTGRFGMAFSGAGTQAGSYYMDTIKIDPVGAPYTSKLAVKNGSYGLAVPVMDGTERYGEFTDPTAETISTGEKWFDPNTITMAENDAYDFMYSPGEWAVSCVKSATAYTIKLTVDKDSGTSVTSAYEITDAFHLIRAVVASATGAGADDGYGYLYIDGVLQEALTGIDNDTKSVGEVRYGARNTDATTYGIFYMDDCKWRGGRMVITGRVEKYVVVPAGSFRLGSSPPGVGTEGTFSTLLFASTGTESAYYNIHVPGDWAVGTDMKLAVYWAPTSGAAGGVAWEFDWEARASEGNEALGAGSTHVDIHDATQELDNELLETAYGTISGASLAVDDTIGVHLYRDHDDGIDNYGADAALIHLEIEYYSDKLGVAT